MEPVEEAETGRSPAGRRRQSSRSASRPASKTKGGKSQPPVRSRQTRPAAQKKKSVPADDEVEVVDIVEDEVTPPPSNRAGRDGGGGEEGKDVEPAGLEPRAESSASRAAARVASLRVDDSEDETGVPKESVLQPAGSSNPEEGGDLTTPDNPLENNEESSPVPPPAKDPAAPAPSTRPSRNADGGGTTRSSLKRTVPPKSVDEESDQSPPMKRMKPADNPMWSVLVEQMKSMSTAMADIKEKVNKVDKLSADVEEVRKGLADALSNQAAAPLETTQGDASTKAPADAAVDSKRKIVATAAKKVRRGKKVKKDPDGDCSEDCRSEDLDPRPGNGMEPDTDLEEDETEKPVPKYKVFMKEKVPYIREVFSFDNLYHVVLRVTLSHVLKIAKDEREKGDGLRLSPAGLLRFFYVLTLSRKASDKKEILNKGVGPEALDLQYRMLSVVLLRAQVNAFGTFKQPSAGHDDVEKKAAADDAEAPEKGERGKEEETLKTREGRTDPVETPKNDGVRGPGPISLLGSYKGGPQLGDTVRDDPKESAAAAEKERLEIRPEMPFWLRETPDDSPYITDKHIQTVMQNSRKVGSCNDLYENKKKIAAGAAEPGRDDIGVYVVDRVRHYLTSYLYLTRRYRGVGFLETIGHAYTTWKQIDRMDMDQGSLVMSWKVPHDWNAVATADDIPAMETFRNPDHIALNRDAYERFKDNREELKLFIEHDVSVRPPGKVSKRRARHGHKTKSWCREVSLLDVVLRLMHAFTFASVKGLPEFVLAGNERSLHALYVMAAALRPVLSAVKYPHISEPPGATREAAGAVGATEEISSRILNIIVPTDANSLRIVWRNVCCALHHEFEQLHVDKDALRKTAYDKRAAAQEEAAKEAEAISGSAAGKGDDTRPSREAEGAGSVADREEAEKRRKSLLSDYGY